MILCSSDEICIKEIHQKKVAQLDGKYYCAQAQFLKYSIKAPVSVQNSIMMYTCVSVGLPTDISDVNVNLNKHEMSTDCTFSHLSYRL